MAAKETTTNWPMTAFRLLGILGGVNSYEIARDMGPSVLISPEALIGGLGGAAIGGGGRYGLDRLLGRKSSMNDVLDAATLGAAIGHSGGVVTHAIKNS